MRLNAAKGKQLYLHLTPKENDIKNYDDVLLIGESVLDGKVSTSLIMWKLSSYHRTNDVGNALREMGQIEKKFYFGLHN